MRSIPRRALLAAGLGLTVEAGAYAAGRIARAPTTSGRWASAEACTDGPAGEGPSETPHALPSGAAGWLAVTGTAIDRPVMQATPDDPGFYLSHGEDGGLSAFGSLYLDHRCAPGNPHLMVYGHHVLDMPEEMFSPIHDAYLPEVFEDIGEARLQERGSDSMGNWRALCALRVDKSFADIQRFGLEGDEFKRWLGGIVVASDARGAEANRLAAGATRCLTLVTCSSAASGQRWRTLLLFAR